MLLHAFEDSPGVLVDQSHIAFGGFLAQSRLRTLMFDVQSEQPLGRIQAPASVLCLTKARTTERNPLQTGSCTPCTASLVSWLYGDWMQA
jgi:hypothetical protein